MKNKIIISGQPGAGSTTISLILSYILKYKYLYTGMVQRELAKALGYDVEGEGFVKYTVEAEHKYDKYVDEYVREEFLKAEKIVLDSKIQGFFDYSKEEVLKVFVLCDRETRNQRILAQGRKDGQKLLEEREKANRDDWLKIYGFDVFSLDQIKEKYDVVIDSSKQSVAQTVEVILKEVGFDMKFSDIETLSKVFWSKGKSFFREELQKQNLLFDTKSIVNKLLRV